jgi:hypothetical protein
MPWLNLHPPRAWEQRAAADRRWAWPPAGGLLLEWFPLGVLPARPIEWVLRVMTGGTDGAVGRAVEQVRARTKSGWHVVLAEVDLTRGSTWGRKIGAFYAFFEHGGHATVVAQDRASWEAERERVRAAFLEAGPSFDDLLLSVEDFHGDRR